MNQHASALGKLAKGIKKTGLSPQEILRRRNLALSNSLKIKALNASKIIQNTSCNNP